MFFVPLTWLPVLHAILASSRCFNKIDIIPLDSNTSGLVLVALIYFFICEIWIGRNKLLRDEVTREIRVRISPNADVSYRLVNVPLM